ncbi:uncharacterized protein LOC141620412 [Silene latifolia]|uniref:uncharacterized protein LOC141620412 n=1 Tax=Silene latifolia TaxID=37657 RepID=UPI003D77C7DA
MSMQANSILITLIPKKKISCPVIDFRPISCCTTIYKTISKVLVTRLKVVLAYLVGPEQAAFLQGRSIFENIMLSQLLMLQALNFLNVFIKWIMGCISTSWFSIKLNGATHDDLMLFTRGDGPSVKGVVGILEKFTSWSGLHANVSKTEIYFGAVSPTIKAQILQTIGFTEGQFPFMYLGIPLNSVKNSMQTYGALITKIQNSLMHWTNNFLSYAGRIQILNSIIFGMTNFWTRKLVSKLGRTFADPILKEGIKDRHSKSLCSIIKVKEEIMQRTGSIDAGQLLVTSWEKHGKFKVGLAYDWFRTKGDNISWAPVLQGRTVIPRHRIPAALTNLGNLPTVDRPCSRGMIMVNRCALCKQMAETHRHLFLWCSYSRQIWQGLMHWMDISNRSNDLRTELRWMQSSKGKRHWKHSWR